MARPTSYREEYAEKARKLCLLGLTDVQLAEVFDVTEKTLNNWKHAHPEFFQSLKAGKEIADGEVAASLYSRACGYSHLEEKVFCTNGEITTHETIKHYPPDTAAAFIWLKNRQPQIWRDKPEGEDNPDLPSSVVVNVGVVDGRVPDADSPAG